MSDDWRKYRVPEAEDLRPPRRRARLYSFGPNELHLRETVILEGGPDEFVRNNPQLFATGTTSRHEGYAYWALLKIIGPEGMPGKNGMVWYYQSKVGGGSHRPGGATVDFVVEGTGRNADLGIRIVTPFYHSQAGAGVRAFDEEQRFMLLDNDIFAVDVFSKSYINDNTGRAAIVTMARALESTPDYGPNFRSTGI